MAIDLEKILESENLVEYLEEEELNKIGEEASKGYDADLESRKDYEEQLECWTKLALQVADS